MPAFVLWLLCMAAADAAPAATIEHLQTLRANPLSGLRNVQMQYQANVGVPADGETQSVLTLQAVWPFPLGQDWSLITYPVVQVISQPETPSGDGRVAGLGDTILTAAVTPRETEWLDWGIGAELEYPDRDGSRVGH